MSTFEEATDAVQGIYERLMKRKAITLGEVEESLSLVKERLSFAAMPLEEPDEVIDEPLD